MNFHEHPPSTQWSILAYQGIAFAEVWLKPEEAPMALSFRLPQASFHNPVLSPLLTPENLLKAVGITPDEVDSWQYAGDVEDGLEEYEIEYSLPLPPLPENVAYLYLHIHVRKTVVEVIPPVSEEGIDARARWQSLLSRWNNILGMEVTIDSLRLRMESLRGEIETVTNKPLSSDEKLFAYNADVAQWTKAKNRARFVLPKLKEFIHRANWAMGAQERKKLEDVFKNEFEPPDSLLDLDRELHILLKDRQILTAQGVTAYQEGRGGCDEVNRTLRTLQTNAAAHAVKKRAASRAKNKSF